MARHADRRLVLLLSKAHHALFRAIDRGASSSLGVTGAQIGPLFFVARNPGCVQGDVGKELGINKAATSKLISRMEDAELIERRPSEEDGRVITLHLTQRARSVIDAARPLVRKVNKQLTDGFTAAEIDVVSRFLSTVSERFEE